MDSTNVRNAAINLSKIPRTQTRSELKEKDVTTVWQGSRLASLQTLLKAEELENEADDRIMEDINRGIFAASTKLCKSSKLKLFVHF
jgi:hypothetical protein